MGWPGEGASPCPALSLFPQLSNRTVESLRFFKEMLCAEGVACSGSASSSQPPKPAPVAALTHVLCGYTTGHGCYPQMPP